jgi:hypothetical protein
MNIVERKIVKKLGECEVCGTLDVECAVYYGGISQCDSCIEAERALLATSGANRTVVQSQKIDSTVELASDVYNLETVACVEIQAAIQNDEGIKNKHYMVADTIKTRIELFDKAIFAKKQELDELNSRRRAAHTFIKESAFVNQLRNEEREKLRLEDISYTPQSPTKPTIKAASAPSSKQIKAAEIREMAVKHNVPEDMRAAFIMSVQFLMKIKHVDLTTASVSEAPKFGGN